MGKCINIFKSLLVICSFCFFSNAIATSEKIIQIIPVDPSPEPEICSVHIIFPEPNSIEKEDTIWLQLRVRGYPLGANPLLVRRNDVPISEMGQSIHIIIDDREYFPFSGPSLSPFEDQGNYFQSLYKLQLPYDLKEGNHQLRVFLARSFGESLKGQGAFDAVNFYVKDKKIVNDLPALNTPFIIYNEPSNNMPLKAEKPVLLDYYLRNCKLSEDGFKVKIVLDNNITRVFSKWTPCYIYGLKKGTHTLTIELVDERNDLVGGEYNKITKEFTLN